MFTGRLAAALLIVLSLAGTACSMRMTLPPATPLDPRAPPPTDDQLTAAVQDRLDHVWVFDRRDIRIRAQDRIVYMIGWVPTSYERDLAVQIARTTPGVASVNSDIRLTYPW